MKSESGLWRKMLEAVRTLKAEDVAISSSALGVVANLDVKVASAWLCLLGKWGYVRRVGKETVAGRWGYIWELTRFGIEYRPGKAAKRAVKPTPLKIAANPGKKKK